MATSKVPRALVIGGSLGGLFAATALRAIGWDVQVFERSGKDLDSRGGGIVLQPDILAAFNFAGIRQAQAEALGVPSGDRIYLDSNGSVIHRHFMPQTQTSWSMLYVAMSRALPEQLVKRGEEFIRFEQVGESVRAHFASGRVEECDLLIGADGPRSTLRAQLLPEVTPTFSGYVAWRGLVPELELSEQAVRMLRNTFAFQQGVGHLMLEYLVPGANGSTTEGERRWNWVWYRKVAAGGELAALMTDKDGHRRNNSLPPGMARMEFLLELREAASRLLAPTFQDLVAASKEPFVQGILDLQVRKMVFGRAVLLGDAAFIPRPHTAGSTAKAAANAVALAEALSSGTSGIDASLGRWEQQQLREGKEMLDGGVAMGNRIMGIQGAAATARPAQAPSA